MIKYLRETDPARILLDLTVALIFVFLLSPIVVVVLASLNAGNFLTFPPQGLSLRWFVNFFSKPYFIKAYIFSLQLAFASMLISTVLGTMAALVLTRRTFPGSTLLNVFFTSPLMIPGLLIGLGLFQYFMALGVRRSFMALLCGHIVITLPFVIRTVSAALYNLNPSVEEASRTLGAGPITTFMKVTFPLIFSGVLAGSIFAFIASFGQFDISLFLVEPNMVPLPIALFNYLKYYFDPTAAAASTFAILITIIAMLLSSKFSNFGQFFKLG